MEELTYSNILIFRRELEEMFARGKVFSYSHPDYTYRRRRIKQVEIRRSGVGRYINLIPTVGNSFYAAFTSVRRPGGRPRTDGVFKEPGRTRFQFAKDRRSVRITSYYGDNPEETAEITVS